MSAIATQLWRVDAANATFFDAFVRSPAAGGQYNARVVLIGIDVHLPSGGTNLVCKFASGEREVEASGEAISGNYKTCTGGCYQAWSCPIPQRVYEAALHAKAPTLDLKISAAARVRDGLPSRMRRSTPISATLWPYTSAANSGARIGATTMVRDDVAGRRASLLEHIEYHRLIGFDSWYVYDNDSSDGTMELLGRYTPSQAYMRGGGVRVLRWTHRRKAKEGNNRVQRAALNHALYAFAHHLEWLAFMDFDEFLTLPPGLSLASVGPNEDSLRCAADASFSSPSWPTTRSSARRADGERPCSYHLMIVPAHDRESPASTDCGAASGSAEDGGVAAHSRRVAGCRLQRVHPGEPKVLVSVNSSGLPPPVYSPHCYHPNCESIFLEPDKCATKLPEELISLRHFSASSLHGGTCASMKPCVADDSLDWVARHLEKRLRRVLRRGGSCLNASTAAPDSKQWLTTTVEHFGRECFEPHVAASAEHADEAVWPLVPAAARKITEVFRRGVVATPELERRGPVSETTCHSLVEYLHAVWGGGPYGFTGTMTGTRSSV